VWKLAEDTISRDEIEGLAEWLLSGPRLTQGELVAAFEARWSEWLGTRHSIFVSSGTTANLALVACVGRRLGRPPRIGVSAVTWATNVTPAQLLRYPITVFDIDRRTLGVSPAAVCEAMAAGRIDVLFVTHLLGFNALTDEVLRTAAEHGVLILEDCCEAHGARHGEAHVGTRGIGGTFSFYFGHHMSTIEGGMVSTDDDELADELRLFRSHGLARESNRFDEYRDEYPNVDPRFLFVLPGLNLRSTELNAWLGLQQLPALDDRIAARNANLSRFLAGAPDSLWRDYETLGVSSFALPLIANDPAMKVQVDRVIDELAIESRPVVAGNLLEQPFLQGADVAVYGGSVPNAEHVHRFGTYVGNGHHVTAEMVDALLDRLAA
jgi:CDP-4-dehydro-6-deoxyglucose reductase, E1